MTKSLIVVIFLEIMTLGYLDHREGRAKDADEAMLFAFQTILVMIALFITVIILFARIIFR